jgi:hypothetical protein
MRCHHCGGEDASLPAKLRADRLQQNAKGKQDDGTIADDEGKGRTKHDKPAGGAAIAIKRRNKMLLWGGVCDDPIALHFPGKPPGQQTSAEHSAPDLD